jgi:hypothetical protein
VIADDEILCNIPLNVLAPKVTIKCAREISLLYDMFMPSTIQLKMLKYYSKSTSADVKI